MITKKPKYYVFLMSIVVITQCVCLFYSQKRFTVFGIDSTCSGVLFPVVIYLIEIIGECYGYEYSRQTVLINLTGHFIVAFYTLLFNFIPMQHMSNNDTIGYSSVLSNVWFAALVAGIGGWVGDQFSAKYVPYTKIRFLLLFSPKQLLTIRLIIIHLISEFLTIMVSYSLFFFIMKGLSFFKIMSLIFGTMLMKSIIAFVLLYPAKWIVLLIKYKEGFENNDKEQNYKLFKFNIDESKIESQNTIYIKERKKYVKNI